MPIFVAALIGALVSAAGSLVGRVLLALGVGYVTYTGVSAGLDLFKGWFVEALGSAGPVASGLAGTLKLDVAFGILMAGVTARLVLNGLTSGVMRKMVIK